MRWILFLLALLWVAAGAALVLDTARVRAWYERVAPRERFGVFGGMAAAVGGVLVVGAFVGEAGFWWPFLLGLAALGKGVVLLRAPGRAEAALRWWTREADERTCRALGLLVYTLGAALLGSLL